VPGDDDRWMQIGDSLDGGAPRRSRRFVGRAELWVNTIEDDVAGQRRAE